MDTQDKDRRSFLHSAVRVGAGVVVAAGSVEIARTQDKQTKKKQEQPDEVGPTEDLMREHGILNRVLLIYEHFVRQVEAKQDFKPELVTRAASTVRDFVEDYHERQEEQFLFPRYEKARLLTGLVSTLNAQHQAGRKLTDRILSLAGARNAQDRAKLAQAIQQFTRMYRPHEAREDTVLFPALRTIVSALEFEALGDQFERNEHKQFGADGFEMYRDRVAELEKQLGIYDLSQFTPKL